MGVQQTPGRPEARQVFGPLTVILVVITFAAWVACYLIWVRPPINRFLFSFLPAFPMALHVVLMLVIYLVPVGIVISLAERISRPARKQRAGGV